jgi:hypothetical protein
VKGYVHQLVIACGCEVIARHERSYERETVVFDPMHYLALLEQKTRALDQAAPLAGWQLPECFAQLRRLLEARLKKQGSREYVQVLRLMETFAINEVTHAIEDALKLGTISFDAVRHLLLCRIERRPPRLDMDIRRRCCQSSMRSSAPCSGRCVRRNCRNPRHQTLLRKLHSTFTHLRGGLNAV